MIIPGDVPPLSTIYGSMGLLKKHSARLFFMSDFPPALNRVPLVGPALEQRSDGRTPTGHTTTILLRITAALFLALLSPLCFWNVPAPFPSIYPSLSSIYPSLSSIYPSLSLYLSVPLFLPYSFPSLYSLFKILPHFRNSIIFCRLGRSNYFHTVIPF